MFVSHRRGWHLLAALTVALALAGSAVACGDSDDDGGGGGTQPVATDEQGQPPATDDGQDPAPQALDEDGAEGPNAGTHDGGDEADDGSPDGADAEADEVATTVAGMYRSFSEGDAEGVCAVMSQEAREQIAQNVLGGSTDAPEERTCETSLSKFLDVAAASGILERTLSARVDDVSIEGEIATATVTFGAASGKVRLLREDGEWRFGVSALSPGKAG